MSCKVCKHPKSLEEQMVHVHSTHGISIEMQKFKFGWVPDEVKLAEFVKQHRLTGGKGKFKKENKIKALKQTT